MLALSEISVKMLAIQLFDLAGPKCTCAECPKHVASHHKLQAPPKNDSGVQLYTKVSCKTVAATSHTAQKNTNKNVKELKWSFCWPGVFFAANKSQYGYMRMLLDKLWNALCCFVAMIRLCLFCLCSMSGITV